MCIEALSVILQVGSYKLRGGKRIFKMAPDSSPFRGAGLAGIEGNRAVLDCRTGDGAVRADNVEAEVVQASSGILEKQRFGDRDEALRPGGNRAAAKAGCAGARDGREAASPEEQATFDSWRCRSSPGGGEHLRMAARRLIVLSPGRSVRFADAAR